MRLILPAHDATVPSILGRDLISNAATCSSQPEVIVMIPNLTTNDLAMQAERERLKRWSPMMSPESPEMAGPDAVTG